MFHCLPSEALREDPAIVFAIMETRAIREADSLKEDVTQMTPAQIDAWWLLCPAGSAMRKEMVQNG